MKNKYYLLSFFLVASYFIYAQEIQPTPISDSITIVDGIAIKPENKILNQTALFPFFKKLDQLEKTKKGTINIVHIGDSHIQADIITTIIRDSLQKNFGNAGRGLIFPYLLAKTNGPWDIKFSSNQTWNNYKNIYPVTENPVGLSGIALFTKNKDFAIEIKIKNQKDAFQTIKIIIPKNINMFHLATNPKTIILQPTQNKTINYKIKKGDALSIIAKKHNTTIAEIKQTNKLKSNLIKSGAILKIPTKQKEQKSPEKSQFISMTLQQDSLTNYYKSEKPLEKIYILPNKDADQYTINGIILEKDQPGIIYHNIGVNGAKYSDYNKYPLFFEQLKTLKPDLIILSLGTNESFDKMQTVDFINQINLFLENLKKQNIDTNILITTPPPSLFQRKYPNVFVADYSQVLLKQPIIPQVAIWDLFTLLGGLYGVDQNFKNGLIAPDKIHYTKQGYIAQGQLLNEIIMKTYNNFKNPTKN